MVTIIIILSEMKFSKMLVSLLMAVLVVTGCAYHYMYFKRGVLMTASLRPLPDVTTCCQDGITPLPQDVLSSVSQFILFIGYPRSGHSIVGSLLDAHPHMVISHEISVLQWLSKINTTATPLVEVRDKLFNMIYKNSYKNVFKNGTRSKNRKGYNLTVDNGWQGRYRQHIDVMGDKRGGGTAKMYNEDTEAFNAAYKLLVNIIPVSFIHCVRDVISTMMLYSIQKRKHQDHLISSLRQNQQKRYKNDENQQKRYKNDEVLHNTINIFFDMADSVANVSQHFDSNVLEIHNYELISHPVETVIKFCQYLNVDCPKDYVQSCSNKVFSKLSRTRFDVDWSEDMKATVQRRLEQYTFFRGYSYDSLI